MEDKVTLLQEENSALAMRITTLEAIVEDISTNDDDNDNEKTLVCHKGKKKNNFNL